MDKSLTYHQLIRQTLTEIAEYFNRVTEGDVETLVVFDDEHERYMLVDSGWEDKKRVRSIIGFIKLKGGKIWVEEDYTEEGITSYFLKAGVPKHDIVLGFKPPTMRPYTEFAVA